MKKIALIFLLLFLASALRAEVPPTETAPPAWTVEKAKEEAFRDIQSQVDLSGFRELDPDWLENKIALSQGRTFYENRKLTKIQGGAYGVETLCATQTAFYLPSGKLTRIALSASPGYYNDTCPPTNPAPTNPAKTYQYAYPSGKLIRVDFTVDHDQYVFNPDGTLSAHWVGNHCFKSDGSSCGTRKTGVK